MPRCYVALGGNLGPVEQNFERALERLDARSDVRVVARSGVYESGAVGEHAGRVFRNAAAALETTLDAHNLLELLQQTEDELGRQREGRWRPRTIDLDLVFYGSDIIDEPNLQIPHPACWYRRFVLDPLAEIAAGVIHPEKDISVAELRDRLLVRPLIVCVAGVDQADFEQMAAALQPEFAEVDLAWRDHADARVATDAALIVWFDESGSDVDRSEFDQLPVVPRLDASHVAAEDRASFLRDVLYSALGR